MRLLAVRRKLWISAKKIWLVHAGEPIESISNKCLLVEHTEFDEYQVQQLRLSPTLNRDKRHWQAVNARDKRLWPRLPPNVEPNDLRLCNDTVY